jgi:hypothetical protein
MAGGTEMSKLNWQGIDKLPNESQHPRSLREAFGWTMDTEIEVWEESSETLHEVVVVAAYIIAVVCVIIWLSL